MKSSVSEVGLTNLPLVKMSCLVSSLLNRASAVGEDL